MDANQLAAAIERELQTYSDAVAVKIGEAVEIVGNEVNAEIKSHVTFNQPTGKYVNWSVISVNHAAPPWSTKAALAICQIMLQINGQLSRPTTGGM